MPSVTSFCGKFQVDYLSLRYPAAIAEKIWQYFWGMRECPSLFYNICLENMLNVMMTIVVNRVRSSKKEAAKEYRSDFLSLFPDMLATREIKDIPVILQERIMKRLVDCFNDDKSAVQIGNNLRGILDKAVAAERLSALGKRKERESPSGVGERESKSPRASFFGQLHVGKNHDAPRGLGRREDVAEGLTECAVC